MYILFTVYLHVIVSAYVLTRTIVLYINIVLKPLNFLKFIATYLFFFVSLERNGRYQFDQFLFLLLP